MKKRRSAAMELTPLLDVIFIMLFMLMGQVQKDGREARENAEARVMQITDEYAAKEEELLDLSEDLEKRSHELDSRSAEVEEREDNIGRLESRIKGYESFDEFAAIITVTLDNKRGDAGTRRLTVTDNKGTHFSTVEADNSNELANKLTYQLKSAAEKEEYKKAQVTLIVFEYDPRKAVRQDCIKIEKAITEITNDESNGNFFYKCNETNLTEEKGNEG